MPGGFKKKRYGDAGSASQVNKSGPQREGSPDSHDGRANPKGGAGYQDGEGKRDFAERIYRDRRS